MTMSCSLNVQLAMVFGPDRTASDVKEDGLALIYIDRCVHAQ